MITTVVVGPPCAGKSTWVDRNAPAGAARLDFDRLALVMGSGDEHSAPPVVFEAALAARRGVIGWAVDPDAEHPDGELYLIYSFISPNTVEVLAAAGARFHLVDPGIDECLKRADADNRPPRTVEAIHRWYSDPPRLPDPGDDEPKGHDMTKILRAVVGDVETRSAGDGSPPTAEFEAYASIFGNVDSYGDVMTAGAFTRSLSEWEARGAPIPVLWGHNMDDPDYNIGAVVSATEDERGLRVRCSIDLDSPKGATVHRLLKAKRVREMSFAFLVRDARDGDKDGRSVRYVDDVDLIEVSVVPMGANPDTEILAVRSVIGPPATPCGDAPVDDGDDVDEPDSADPDPAPHVDPDPPEDTPPADPDPAAKSPTDWPLLAELTDTLYRRVPGVGF